MSRPLPARQRSGWLFSLAILLTGLLGQAFLRVPSYIGYFNDDACYLLRAFAIAGGGQCRICDQVLSQGRAFTLGWPALLTPVSLLAGDRLWVYPCLSLALILATGILLGWIARRYFGTVCGYLCASAFLMSTGSFWFSTSTMSEPLFVFLICALLLSSREPKWSVLTGVLLGWCLTTRTEGWAVFLALLLALALTRRWREVGLSLAVSLPIWVLVSSTMPKSTPHFAQLFDGSNPNFSLWQFLARWVDQQSSALAQCYLGNLSVAGPWSVAVLSTAALLGWYRWWRREPGFGPWFGLALTGVLLLWPYVHPRYWYALLPIWVLGIAFALPERWRKAGLISLLVLQLVGALYVARPDHQATVDLYRSLRQTPPSAVITCLHDCRVHVFSHRATIAPARLGSLAELLAFMASSKSGFVVWDSDQRLISNLSGGHQGEFPPRFELWIERSPIFATRTSNSAGVVAELLPSFPQCLAAFELYRQAFQTENAPARLAVLQRCLEIVPDFPGARLLWAQTALQAGLEPDKMRARLIQHFDRYPHDFEAALLTLPALVAVGDHVTARKIAERTSAEATRLGLPREQRALSGYLNSTPK